MGISEFEKLLICKKIHQIFSRKLFSEIAEKI